MYAGHCSRESLGEEQTRAYNHILNTLERVPSLKTLVIQESRALRVVAGLENLSSLNSLIVKACRNLEFKELLATLQQLKLINCPLSEKRFKEQHLPNVLRRTLPGAKTQQSKFPKHIVVQSLLIRSAHVPDPLVETYVLLVQGFLHFQLHCRRRGSRVRGGISSALAGIQRPNHSARRYPK
ncbi:hypothetical protein ZIOFF_043805 [Zingiber officinale]|uniref:Uncharacterized protein n=1 Tax=Zingiber officinale TaxID=94328 RepID=A0A8J5KQU6_ZINOF|nr:hypothetical protein ZIOFF_043805 [Zingiber officinale]